MSGDPDQLLTTLGPILSGRGDFRDIFNHLPMGVLATDADGIITYYNPYQSKIDSLDASFALGRHVTKVYGPDPGPSLVMTCLESGQPIIGFVCVYRTAYGKLINSSHYVYPFLEQGRVSGCLCFIQSFSTLEVNSPSVSNISDLAPLKKKPVSFERIVGRNLELQKAVANAVKASKSPSPVLIYGETGTGKEMFASSIHQASSRCERAFVAINCAAIPDNLLEGILFGTTRGAFTGAVDKKGLLEEANDGTILLDEVDSMSLSLQPKLLRVLQEKKVRRIGSATETELDVKIISTTSVFPLLAVERGTLRSDLFYRLGVVLISIPPLRRRIDDLDELLTFFILKYNTILGKKVVRFNRDVIKLLRAYDWPGNIREMEHLVEGSLNLAGNDTEIDFEFLPDHFRERCERSQIILAKNECQHVRSSSHDKFGGQFGISDEDDEIARIAGALKTSFGNTTLAAKLLGISRQLLSYRIKKYNINKKNYQLYL
ncbi:MAG: sigma 54-interacting transcriptional regulator [Deltaproteobacteria bacterium]|jgi:arginine utilization regulatory protein|nr:sigma 54-interacting transcriptional regulator [Deltaproteobacteria bacterium]